MGPRSNDRGNPAARPRVKVGEMLQWGRDQMIAEMRSQIAAMTGWKTLQWGRDQMIAEIAAPASRRFTPGCFNGAAIK